MHIRYTYISQSTVSILICIVTREVEELIARCKDTFIQDDRSRSAVITNAFRFPLQRRLWESTKRAFSESLLRPDHILSYVAAYRATLVAFFLSSFLFTRAHPKETKKERYLRVKANYESLAFEFNYYRLAKTWNLTYLFETSNFLFT